MRAFILAGLLYSTASLCESTVAPLFVIQRSLNRNEVVYDLRLKDSKIDLELPLDDYWRMWAKTGQREELTGFERTRAYGYEIRSAGPETLTFVLVSLRSHPIEVKRKVTGEFVAVFPILKRLAQLTTVFIQLKSGGILPRIDWIEVRGRDLETQEFIYERLIPR